MIKTTPLPSGEAAFFCALFYVRRSAAARFSAMIGGQHGWSR
jgi:hypothetical protein